ncbi:MAG TPA: InlB B-repeat-containing protein [Thermoanaerobaculia bacterium]|nr:InlB B-repeat-containing protein [Thermoanaerobaculia bacterium]
MNVNHPVQRRPFPMLVLAVTLVFLFAAISAEAAIAFDAASRAATTTTGRTSLAWSHTIGGGSDRLLVVGVAAEDGGTADANITGVSYNGVALTAVPSSKISGGGTGIIQTQLFYLLNAGLPAAGTYNVTVTFQGAVDGISAGAVSLTGASQAAPQPAATKVDTSGADSISTSISAPAAGAWVVDVVGSGNSGSFTAGAGQTERWDLAASGMTGATSTKALAATGSTTLSWAHSGANRLAHSLAVVSPSGTATPAYTLTTNVSGSGSISRSPDAASYASGTVVTLTATPAAGFVFSGWSGDLTGTANPATITMSANRTVTATFTSGGTTSYTLTTSVSGSGSVSRSPNASSYPSGTVVTLTATPAAGYQFSGWSGDLTGSANPATITMSANRSVTASFTPTGGGSLDFGLYGWAATNGGTTGGAGGQTVTVSTLADLKFYVGQTAPYIIRVAGTITGNEAITVQSNKSILGVGSDARLVGIGFKIGSSSRFGQIGNIIIRNLIFEKPLAPIDKIGIAYGAHHIWIDHCEFFSDLTHGVDYYDGQLDITHAGDFITVSWNLFHDHFKNSLIGHSDDNGSEDTGHLTVTYHHNFFTRLDGRNPSVRFGTVHVYNNYYYDIRDYGIASRMGAQVRVENNYFDNVAQPIRADTSLSNVAGRVSHVDTNIFVNSGANSITLGPATWTPPYAYPLDPAASVPTIVQQGAGVGKVTF